MLLELSTILSLTKTHPRLKAEAALRRIKLTLTRSPGKSLAAEETDRRGSGPPQQASVERSVVTEFSSYKKVYKPDHPKMLDSRQLSLKVQALLGPEWLLLFLIFEEQTIATSLRIREKPLHLV